MIKVLHIGTNNSHCLAGRRINPKGADTDKCRYLEMFGEILRNLAKDPLIVLLLVQGVGLLPKNLNNPDGIMPTAPPVGAP